MQIDLTPSNESSIKMQDIKYRLKKSLSLFLAKPYYVAALMAAMLIIILLGSWVCVYFLKHGPNTTSTTKESTSLYAFNDKLLDMDAKLALIENQLNSTPYQKNEAATQAELASLKEQINTLSAQTQEAIASGIESTNQQLKTQLSQVNDKVAALTHSIEPTTYLPPSQLPFTVTSIDMIAVTPVVTVKFGYHTIPLETGDNLASWTLQQADFVAQTAIFINQKQQAIKFTLSQTRSIAE